MLAVDRAVLIFYHENGDWHSASGFRIDGEFILTADHCAGGTDYRVLIDGRNVPAQVHVRGDRRVVDLAILRVEDEQRIERVPLARIRTSHAMKLDNCCVLAFPVWKGNGRAQLDGYVPTGEAALLPGLVPAISSGTYQLAFKCTTPPPASASRLAELAKDERTKFSSQWRGASGGAVIHGGHVIGVLSNHVLPEGDSSLAFTPVTAIDALSAELRNSFLVALGCEDTAIWPVFPNSMEQHRGRVAPKDAAAQKQVISLEENCFGGSDEQIYLAVPTFERRSPSQVPRDTAYFVGRTAELSGCVESIIAARDEKRSAIVAITGPAGIGKSALAVRLAAQLREHFPGGQLYCDLRSGREVALTINDALAAFLASLGVDTRSLPADEGLRAAFFRSHLENSGVLIVVDNAPESMPIDLLFPATPTCATIVTGRQGLFFEVAGVHRVDLSPLTLSNAELLLSNIVGKSRCRRERTAAKQLCRLCDCFPLAIAIAGARLVARPHWSIKKLVDLLSVENRRVFELESGTLGIRAAFELSYRDRPDDQKLLFCLCSLLTGETFSAFTGALLLGVELGVAEALAEELAEANLIKIARIENGEVRFSYHDLMRLYARNLMESECSAEDRDAAIVRLVNGYILRANTAAEQLRSDLIYSGKRASELQAKINPKDASDWFGQERENIVCSLAAAHELGMWRLVINLATAVSDQFEMRAYWHEWRLAMELAADSATKISDEYAEAYARRNLGRVLRESGRWGEALEQLERSKVCYDNCGDRVGAGDSLRSIGTIYRYQGSLDDAMCALQESLAIFSDLNNPSGRAKALRALGLLYRDMREYERAMRVHMDGLSIFEEICEYRGIASSLRNIGILFTRMGKADEAGSYFVRSLAAFREMKDPRGQASVLRNLGDCMLIAERFDTAGVLYREGLRVFRKLGDMHWEAATLRSLGDLEKRLTNWAVAAQYYQQALQIYERLGDSLHAQQVREYLQSIA